MTSEKDQYIVSGMDCADCALHVEKEVKKIPGITRVYVNAVTGLMEVEHPDQPVNPATIKQAVKKAGYNLEDTGNQVSRFRLQNGLNGEAARHAVTILRKFKNVTSVSLIQDSGEIVVHHRQHVRDIVALIDHEDLGLNLIRSETESGDSARSDLLHLMLSGFLIAAGFVFWYLTDFRLPATGLLALGIAIGGYPMLRKGISEARVFQPGMNFLMSVAVTGAMILGEWTEAGMVVFLFSLAQYLERLSLERARRSVGSLVNERPVTARLVEADAVHIIAVEQVKKGQIIAVKPGERIPVDGVVRKGRSAIDQAILTGESMPVRVHADSPVYAGTLNTSGYIEIEAGGTFGESNFSKINRLVTEAQAKKAPQQMYVEKFTRYYTPLVILVAVFTAVIPPQFFAQSWSDWIYRALVLLVIACPCAFVISTPVTIISGLTSAFRKGILIRGGLHLEKFNEIDLMAFDKTGTLTRGVPRIRKIEPLNDNEETYILKIASALESGSDHPLATAITGYAEKKNITFPRPENVHEIEGRGIRGEIDGKIFIAGNHRLFEEYGWCDNRIHDLLKKIEDENHTAVLVGNESGLLGIIAITDSLRDSAEQAISELKFLGIKKTVMLTGDNHRTAESIGKHARLDEIYAELLPADKLKTISDLQKQGFRVAMIGDGVNDAPALAAADIGVAMAVGGSDTAMATADIALMDDDLQKLPFLKRLSARTISVVRQNILIALTLKFGFLLLAIPGLATMWMAVFADMGASLIVLFNGLRVLAQK